MKTRKTLAAASAAALTVGGIVLLQTTSATADEPLSLDEARDQIVGTVDPGILDAMQRDFDLSLEGVYDRLAVEAVAEDIAPLAESELGDAYAGLWVDGGESVVVAVTDESLTDAVEDLGAEAKVVENTLSDLDEGVAALDAYVKENGAPDGVHSWRPGIAANSVTVSAESQEIGEAFAESAGMGGSVDVVVNPDSPQPFADIVGGEAYEIDGQARCSVGFSATHPEHGDGFVTAGHCDIGSGAITGGVGEGGQFQASMFPGNDWAFVQAGDGWTVSATAGDRAINNSDEAEIGASVCRAGSTTGFWHCGEIVDKGVTVDYPEGSVDGMTQTTVCAEPGDSGGSYVTDNSAQGITSGGSGDCTSGGETFFEPVLRALSETGSELTVA
ncbi:MAG: S1 family peptidase [Stackebrandtia sp.]